MVKCTELIHEFPHSLIGCVENVSPVVMDIYSFNILCITITAYMVSFFNNKTPFTLLCCQISKSTAKQSCTNYYEVIFFHNAQYYDTTFFFLLYHEINLKESRGNFFMKNNRTRREKFFLKYGLS